MGNFEDDLRGFQARSRSAEAHMRMLAGHAEISRERAWGFVRHMGSAAILPEPVCVRIPYTGRTPRALRRTGGIQYQFPRVGQGWAITEFLARSDTNRYLVVLDNADTVECFNGSAYPNQPTERFHDATFSANGTTLRPESAPFFHDSDYELLLRATERLLRR